MKLPKTLVFVLCALLTRLATGQDIDSVRMLKTIEVTQSRLRDYVIAGYELPLDSSALAYAANGSMSELLRKQGFGHLRSYGPGGLATASFRGTGSSHTAVLWNGIDLVSPSSGQLDLSLVPAALFEDVSIQTGGSTSLSGNGSIGGNIHVNNNLKFNEGLTARAASHLGSFGNYSNSAGLTLSGAKLASSTNIFWNKGENAFPFINRNVFPARTETREHAAFDQKGILQQIALQSARHGIFSLRFWYQKSHVEIPNATTILRRSQATEENSFYRALGGWNYNKDNLELTSQIAFIHHDLQYADPLLNEYSLNSYNSIVQNTECNFRFGDKSQLTSGIRYTWEQGEAIDFGSESPVRNRVALYSAFKTAPTDRLELALSLREELVNGETTPLTSTLSTQFLFTDHISAFFNLSRNYRLPTFNDLYWKGSGTQGNPELKPEHSLGGEAGINVTKSAATLKVILFNNYVDNWIQWSPQGAQAWIPQNIKKVWARGIESQLSVNKQWDSVGVKLTGQYSLTMSTNESIYENGNPAEEGKQLILTPRHEASLTAEAAWKKYSLRIVGSFTGKQFNDSDNSPYNILPSYLVTNVWFSRKIKIDRFDLSIIAEVNNLFDVAYQGRPGYPFPGINYKGGIRMNFNKPNKYEF